MEERLTQYFLSRAAKKGHSHTKNSQRLHPHSHSFGQPLQPVFVLRFRHTFLQASLYEPWSNPISKIHYHCRFKLVHDWLCSCSESSFQPLTPSRLTKDCIITPINTLSTPQLSLLFIVLALAAQLDPSPSSEWLSSSFYYTLSRAALALEDIHVNAAIETVESIGLQGLFLLRHDGSAVPERAWAMVGLSMRCAQAVSTEYSLTMPLLKPF